MQNSSWIALVFFTRTFSNTIETFLVSSLLYLATKKLEKNSNNHHHGMLTGFVIGFGCFVRITFPLFAFPLFFYFLARLFYHYQTISLKKQSKMYSIFYSFLIILRHCTEVAFGIGFAFMMCITMDSIFVFGQKQDSLLEKTKLEIIFAPLNNLLYNLDNKNLQEHGLHPPYLHLFVNLQLLFGFFPIFILIETFLNRNYRVRNFWLLSQLFIPVFCLSMFPHQEARFLLPCLLPLVLLAHDFLYEHQKFLNSRNKFWVFVIFVTWILFNFILTAFFSMFHQAGVVNASNMIERDFLHSSEKLRLFSYHVYMIPKFLFGVKVSNQFDQFVNCGSDYELLKSSIIDSKFSNYSQLVIVGDLQQNLKITNFLKDIGYQNMKTEFIRPHISLDNFSFPKSLSDIGLAVIYAKRNYQ